MQARLVTQGQLVEGVVESVGADGAVVRLLPDGPRGFLHISHVSHEEVESMHKIFTTGSKIKVSGVYAGIYVLIMS